MKGFVIGWLCGVFFLLLALKSPGWAIAVAITFSTLWLTIMACAWAYDYTEKRPKHIHIND